MGFVADAAKGLFGSGSKAAKKAANRVVDANYEAASILRKAGDFGIEKFQNYEQKSTQGLDRLNALINDPNAQKNFIMNNPFFDALATRAQQNILGSEAARGKLYSGGTPEALQNSILLLGNDLLQQQIGNEGQYQSSLENIAYKSAAQQSDAKIRAAGGQASAIQSAGEASGAGVMGQRNAQVGAFNNLASTIIGLV